MAICALENLSLEMSACSRDLDSGDVVSAVTLWRAGKSFPTNVIALLKATYDDMRT